MALHDACRRSARDTGWLKVAERLLDHGADPGVRDGFGALPFDLLADQPPRDRDDRRGAGLGSDWRLTSRTPTWRSPPTAATC
jgi:hypothetical protein